MEICRFMLKLLLTGTIGGMFLYAVNAVTRKKEDSSS